MAPTLPGGAVREWQCYQPQFEPGGMRALQTPEPTGGFRVSVPFRQREPIDGTRPPALQAGKQRQNVSRSSELTIQWGCSVGLLSR
jgi:hypothetical protein